MFTKRDEALLNTKDYSKTIETLQYELKELQADNIKTITTNFNTFFSTQISLFDSKNLIKELIEKNSNLQTIFLKSNSKIMSILNELTETERTKEKVLNLLNIFKQLEKIFRLLNTSTDKYISAGKKSNKLIIYKKVNQIKELESLIVSFKDYSFYEQLDNTLKEMASNLILKLKKEGEIFLKTIQTKFEKLGCLVLLSFKEEKQTLLIENEFQFKKEIEFLPVFNGLYAFRELNEDYFMFFNTKREIVLKNFTFKKIEELNALVGILLVEFYLTNKNREFELSETNLNLIEKYLKLLNESEANEELKISYLINLQHFIKKFYKKFLNEVNEKILLYLYDLMSRFKLKSIKELKQFSNLKSIIFRFHIREVNEVYNKKLEESALLLKQKGVEIEESMSCDRNIKRKLKEVEISSKKDQTKNLMTKLDSLDFKDFKVFLNEIPTETIQKTIIQATSDLLNRRFKESRNKKEKDAIQRDQAICISVLKELGFETDSFVKN